MKGIFPRNICRTKGTQGLHLVSGGVSRLPLGTGRETPLRSSH